MASRSLFEEFDQMEQGDSIDYRSELGIVGLQKIIDENMATSRTVRSGDARADYAFEDFPSFVSEQKDQMERLIDTNEEVTIADDSLETLVDKIRSHIYEVKITNALHSIVIPLAERMETLHLEDRLEALNNHREDVLYQQEIVSAINELSNKMEDSFIRRMVLEYRQFMRNPVWNSIRLLNKMVISPILGLTKTLLFGRKKRESDTDRIVRSVNELTEFMRTGMIDREKTFFDRLKSGGLVGAPLAALGRGAASALGVSRGRAQDREDSLASGSTLKEQNLVNNFSGFVSNLVYGDEVTKRGRVSGVAGSMEDKGEEKTITDLYALFSESTDHESRTASLVEQTNKILRRIEDFGYEQVKGQREALDYAMEKEVADRQQDFIESTRQASVLELMKADNEYQAEILKLTDKSHSVNKKQLDEAEETNRRLFMQTIMRGLNVLTSGIGSLVKGIGSLLGTFLGLKSLGKILGKGGVAKSTAKAGGLMGMLKGAGKGVGRRLPVIGTLLGALGMGSIAMSDDMTTEEKAGEASVLGGGLAGAAGGAAAGGAAGAALGSVVPVLGTAVGGVVGSVLGGAAGMFLGEEAIKPFKDEIGSFMLDLGDSIGDAWNASKGYVASKWNQTQEWFSTNLPKFGDVLSGIPEKLGNAFDSTKNWFSSSITGIGEKISSTVDALREKVSGWIDKLSFGFFNNDDEVTAPEVSNEKPWYQNAFDSVTGIFGDEPTTQQRVQPIHRDFRGEPSMFANDEIANIRGERNFASGLQGEPRRNVYTRTREEPETGVDGIVSGLVKMQNLMAEDQEEFMSNPDNFKGTPLEREIKATAFKLELANKYQVGSPSMLRQHLRMLEERHTRIQNNTMSGSIPAEYRSIVQVGADYNGEGAMADFNTMFEKGYGSENFPTPNQMGGMFADQIVSKNSTGRDEDISRVNEQGIRVTRNNEAALRQIDTGMQALPDGEDRSAYGAMKAAMESYRKEAMEDKKMTTEEINILQEMLSQLAEMNRLNKKRDTKKEKTSANEAFRTNAESSTMANVISGE